MVNKKRKTLVRTFFGSLQKWPRHRVLLWLLLIMVAVYIVNVVLAGGLNSFGIQPRQITSLFNIFTAPFIHGDIFHLINNLIALAVFASLCLFTSVSHFLKVSVFIIIVSGVLVWVFARDAMHIGASGWIYGLWSLAIMRAWYDRSFVNIAVAVMVIFLYGGMVFGLLPAQIGVSFESHLFGALAGALAAIILNKRFTVI